MLIHILNNANKELNCFIHRLYFNFVWKIDHSDFSTKNPISSQSDANLFHRLSWHRFSSYMPFQHIHSSYYF
jgi:hypothetical protein